MSHDISVSRFCRDIYIYIYVYISLFHWKASHGLLSHISRVVFWMRYGAPPNNSNLRIILCSHTVALLIRCPCDFVTKREKRETNNLHTSRACPRTTLSGLQSDRSPRVRSSVWFAAPHSSKQSYGTGQRRSSSGSGRTQCSTAR